MGRAKIPWPPPKSRWPAGFTVHRDGWAKSYHGQTIVISGKTRTAREVQELFLERCKRIDAGDTFIPSGPSVTLRTATAAYFKALDRRVARGLSERQRENLVYESNRFGKFVGGNRLLSSIGPPEFANYYRKFCEGCSPNTIGSVVSRVGAMFNWFKKNGLIDRVIFGDDFARPTARVYHSARLDLRKTFAPEELAEMWDVATPMWRCWIALGFVAGMTNSDLAHLTRDVVDGNVLDYRRRKTGKIRRVIALPQPVLDVLATYRRPEPADERFDGFYFLASNGLPYDEYPDRSRSCREFRWLMEDAGVYQKNRSFTGLRTTFFNVTRNAPAMTRGVIMGRCPTDMAQIDWDNYLEQVDVEPILQLTSSVWETLTKQFAHPSLSRMDAETSLRPSRRGRRSHAG